MRSSDHVLGAQMSGSGCWYHEHHLCCSFLFPTSLRVQSKLLSFSWSGSSSRGLAQDASVDLVTEWVRTPLFNSHTHAALTFQRAVPVPLGLHLLPRTKQTLIPSSQQMQEGVGKRWTRGMEPGVYGKVSSIEY